MASLQWEPIAAGAGQVAEGEYWMYFVLVNPDAVGIDLTRVAKGHLERSPLAFFLVAHAARNTIHFPLGRGPGRPGGDPELEALAESAKAFAERFEHGEKLDGYPAWQVAGTGKFSVTGDARDCPHC